MAEFFSLSASFVFIGVVIAYFRQVTTGDSVPNPVTWFIWTVVMTMNAITFLAMTEKDWIEGSLTITTAIGVGSIFMYSLIKGKFAKIRIWDIIALLLAVGIGIFWATTNDPKITNLLLQANLIVGFIPTIIGLVKKTLHESPLPWCLGITAYILMIIGISINWDGNWYAYGFPVINGLVGNGSVVAIILLQKRR